MRIRLGEAISRCRANKQAYDMDFRVVRHPDGKIIWIQPTISNLPWPECEVLFNTYEDTEE